MDHREMLLALAAEAELQRKYAEAAAADAERWDTDQWCGGCEHYDRGGYEPENGYHAPATCNYAWQQEADGHLDEATTADYELALFCLSKRNACPHALRPLPAPRRSLLDLAAERKQIQDELRQRPDVHEPEGEVGCPYFAAQVDSRELAEHCDFCQSAIGWSGPPLYPGSSKPLALCNTCGRAFLEGQQHPDLVLVDLDDAHPDDFEDWRGEAVNTALPPDPEGMNDQRAALAEAVVVRFIDEAQTDRECALTDLLADLMHWCDRHSVNFTIELELAREHYAAETTDATGGAA